MNCDRAQAVLSARMDDAFVSARTALAASAHAEGCPACAAFATRSARVRAAVRIRTAEPVPDLVEPIMRAVTAEAGGRPGLQAPAREAPPLRPIASGPKHGRHLTGTRQIAAAIVVGVVVGSVAVGGPWERSSNRPVATATVVANVRAAAGALDAFDATFEIRERGLSPEVPERVLDMHVAFLWPQRFRLDVHDRTVYPAASWTPTDFTYVEDVPSVFLSGPSGCVGQLPPGVCSPTLTTVTHEATYSAAAPLPADLIAPIATFGSARGVRTIGLEEVDGREAVHVELSFARAAPMFPFLELGGTWRPFFAGDRVALWLDAEGWFPLRATVFPSTDPARRGWEMRFGRAAESPDTPILDVRAVSISDDAPAASTFAIPGRHAAEVPIESLPDRLGYLPATATDPGELELVTAVIPGPSGAATPSSLLVYADGLDYLRLTERRDWEGPGPFGPVDVAAEAVELPGGGIAYYEPAGDGLGRRLSIHAADTDLAIETSLDRERLLAFAATIPLRALALPPAWRVETIGRLRIEHVDPGSAAALTTLPGLPASLPAGYVAASAAIGSIRGHVVGVTFTLRQPELDAAGAPVSLYVERRLTLPPAGSADQRRIVLGQAEARWTPDRMQLEWIDDGIYRSLRGPLDLRTMVMIAASLGSG